MWLCSFLVSLLVNVLELAVGKSVPARHAISGSSSLSARRFARLRERLRDCSLEHIPKLRKGSRPALPRNILNAACHCTSDSRQLIFVLILLICFCNLWQPTQPASPSELLSDSLSSVTEASFFCLHNAASNAFASACISATFFACHCTSDSRQLVFVHILPTCFCNFWQPTHTGIAIPRNIFNAALMWWQQEQMATSNARTKELRHTNKLSGKSTSVSAALICNDFLLYEQLPGIRTTQHLYQHKKNIQ